MDHFGPLRPFGTIWDYLVPFETVLEHFEEIVEKLGRESGESWDIVGRERGERGKRECRECGREWRESGERVHREFFCLKFVHICTILS